MSSIGQIYTTAKLMKRAVRMDLELMYAGTVMGLAWVVVGPLLLLSIYAVIYAVIFNVRVPDLTQSEYVLNVFSGLVLFLAFASSLSLSTNSLIKDQKLVFSNIPIELVPSKAVVVSHVVLVPATILVIVGDIIFSQPSWHLLMLPIVAILQLIFSIGLGYMLSLLGLVLKDFNFLIQYIVISLIVITPIAYTPSMVPDSIKFFLYLNPLYYFVSANQHLILLNTFPPLFEVVTGLVLTIFMFFAGLTALRRAKMAIMDFL